VPEGAQQEGEEETEKGLERPSLGQPGVRIDVPFGGILKIT